MKKELTSFSKDRKFTTNIIFCLISFIGILLIPSFIFLALKPIIHNNTINNLISDIIFILILFFMYYKDLRKEFNTYKSSFKNNFKNSFKIYIIGFMGMVFCNLVISLFLKNISTNESQVRELLYSAPVFAMISISLIAPITEELVFRKSLQPVIKNKWIYVLISGLLFGGAHILTNIIGGTFVISDLVYVLPYACLGCSFALMDYDTKTTFSSMMFHFLHNTFTALLLLTLYFGGNL